MLEKIKERIPGVALTADIIVGFPGETEEDFLDTLDVVKLKSGYLIQGDIYIEKVNLLLMVSHKQDKLIILPV